MSPATRLLRGYARLAPFERGSYPLARLVRRRIPRHQWVGTFDTPHGLRLSLDLGTYPDLSMAFGLYELDTVRLLRRLLPVGGHFVDGGANLGYVTLLAAQRVGYAGRIDAFEPDPGNRERLVRNLRENGAQTVVTVHPLALGDAPGRMTLHRPKPDRGNHGETSLFAALAGADATTNEVEVARAEDTVRGVPHVVKLDVEGAEPLALRGMTTWLTAPRPPAFVVEHNPYAARLAGHLAGDVFRLICDANPLYRCRRIGVRLRTIATPERLDALTRQGNVLFALPPIA